jgi:hypothetical protein
MKVIRTSVFETNSSSSHSISINLENNLIGGTNLYINPKDNKVHVEFGEFGWNGPILETPLDKLSYLCTMLIQLEGPGIINPNAFLQTEGFKFINDFIADYCDCGGITIDSSIWYDKEYKILEHDGYIDHQSCDFYSNIKEFLFENGLQIADFIFNPGVTVIIDNDNH